MPDRRTQGGSPLTRVTRFLEREGKRIAVGVAGGLIVIVGIVLLPLPGPGGLVILAGLAILATQFVWAHDLLERVRERARHVLERLRGEQEDDGDREADGDGDIAGSTRPSHLDPGAFDGRSDVA